MRLSMQCARQGRSFRNCPTWFSRQQCSGRKGGACLMGGRHGAPSKLRCQLASCKEAFIMNRGTQSVTPFVNPTVEKSHVSVCNPLWLCPYNDVGVVPPWDAPDAGDELPVAQAAARAAVNEEGLVRPLARAAGGLLTEKVG